jgi:hypothetical protein
MAELVTMTKAEYDALHELRVRARDFFNACDRVEVGKDNVLVIQEAMVKREAVQKALRKAEKVSRG